MNIDPRIRREIFWQMKRIRMAEEAIADRYREEKMRCPTHLCIGQEAVAAGVGMALRRDDFVTSGHRAHGHYLAKGGDLRRMISEIYGKSTGCSAGKGGSMHLIDQAAHFMGCTAIVAGTIPIGVGLALSIKLKGTDQVSCVFFGDGAIEEGAFYESVNFAVLKKLPALFICENNLYSVYSPLGIRQPLDRRIFKMVEAMGCPTDHGDGNNALEVFEKVSLGLNPMRQGQGPRFFEFATYRWREHCGPNYDNHIGYRTEQEFLEWKKRDPLPFMEDHLLSSGVLSDADIEEMEKEIQAEIREAFRFADSSPFPAQDELLTQVYEEEKAVS